MGETVMLKDRLIRLMDLHKTNSFQVTAAIPELGRSYIYDIYRGRSKAPTAAKLMLICKHLNINVEVLLGTDEVFDEYIRNKQCMI